VIEILHEKVEIQKKFRGITEIFPLADWPADTLYVSGGIQ